ncbi:MAG: protein kinase [Deltaproteobacteria bacterium]|nr:protein kinase [Deltaproteobacteria bacterium]
MTTDRKCPACGAPSAGALRCAKCGAALRAKDFVIEALLFLSPYTRVYRARRGGDVVALKELSFGVAPDVKSIDRFEREGRVLRQLEHPRIPTFIDAFVDGEGPELRLYIAQTFVPGSNLEVSLDERRFDEPDARRIAAEVLEVLEYLHSRSPALIHRDVKPANLILKPDGSTVLVDFGSVRDLGSSNPASGAGTFEYMPPEQLAGEVDGRSDLYALGATLARLLSRRAVSELRTVELDFKFKPYVNVSEPFADFIERLVARSPNDRPDTAKAALRQLRALPALDVRPPVIDSPTRMIPFESIQKLVAEDGAPRDLQEPSVSARSRSNLHEGHGWIGRPLPNDTVDARMQKLRREAEHLAPGPIHWVPSRLQLEAEDQQGPPWVLYLGDRIFGLRPGGSYVVGRSGDADIVVEPSWERADTVSRKHARIAILRSGARVDDLGSSNGTRVGATNVLVSGPQMKLRRDDAIAFGKLVGYLAPWRR